MSGAAPLSGDLMNQITKIFPNAAIGQGLGMTEAAATVSMHSPYKKLAMVGSSGTLLPGIVAKVVKADGTLCKEGEQGELVVHSPSNALGYLNNPKAYVPFGLRCGFVIDKHYAC